MNIVTKMNEWKRYGDFIIKCVYSFNEVTFVNIWLHSTSKTKSPLVSFFISNGSLGSPFNTKPLNKTHVEWMNVLFILFFILNHVSLLMMLSVIKGYALHEDDLFHHISLALNSIVNFPHLISIFFYIYALPSHFKTPLTGPS